MNEGAKSTQHWGLHVSETTQTAYHQSGEWGNESFADAIMRRVEQDPATVVFWDDAGKMTVMEVFERGQMLARGLGELGVSRGDTVSFVLPNWIEAAVVAVGCALGGFIVNPIIPIYREAEIKFILRNCHCKLIFIPEKFRSINYLEVLRNIMSELPELMHVVVTRGGAEHQWTYEKILQRGGQSTKTLAPLTPDDPLLILYTSGTTGHPKGVIHTSNTLRRIILNSYLVWGLDSKSRLFMPSPITHVTGYAWGIEMPFFCGTSSVFMERWEPDAAVRIIEESGATFAIGATPFLSDLIVSAEKIGTSLPNFKTFVCGGASVPPELVRRGTRVFRDAKVFRVYGSTEAPCIGLGVPDDLELAATTDGRTFGWDVKILNETGEKQPEGVPGEIVAKGGALFVGYTNEVDSAAAFTDDGFFKTGDLGMITHREVISVTGRIKDIIIRGGENISAKEVEDVLYKEGGIREVAVVAMPHHKLGETVCAYVVLNPGCKMREEDVMSAVLNAGLARQKIPERVIFTEELPKTASGKVKKHVLRDDAVRRIERKEALG